MPLLLPHDTSHDLVHTPPNNNQAKSKKSTTMSVLCCEVNDGRPLLPVTPPSPKHDCSRPAAFTAGSTGIQQPSSESGSSDNTFTLYEDETCFAICLEMPGCSGRDLTVLIHDNVLTIEGYIHRSTKSCNADGRSAKRQRLRRQFSIDPALMMVDQGMATMYNGCLTLYAPKRTTL